jgi:hypothetical protein
VRATTINGKGAESTAPKQQIGRPFPKGQSGNPAGRPVGSRNRLGSALLDALYADFQEHGVQVIRQVATEHPHKYLAIVAQLLPREVDVAVDISAETYIEVRDFAQNYRLVRQAQEAIGVGKPLLIEAADEE